jgi:hypothetical protein
MWKEALIEVGFYVIPSKARNLYCTEILGGVGIPHYVRDDTDDTACM